MTGRECDDTINKTNQKYVILVFSQEEEEAG